MKAIILPGRLRGRVFPPPLAAQAHRLLLAAALADGTSRISGLSFAEDMQATLSAIRALGAGGELERTGQTLTASVTGTRPGPTRELPVLDCRGSVDTLRLLLPLAIVLRGGGVFRGREHVLKAELGPYRALFARNGIRIASGDSGLTVRGVLRHGIYRLRGDVSSQFVCGLLLALPLLRGLSLLNLSSALESRETVSLTVEILHNHGIELERQGWSRFAVPGGQRYVARDSHVEGDYGLTAFLYAAQGMGNPLDIQGLDPRSGRNDSVIRRISARLCDPGTTQIDAGQCLNLVPAIAAQAAVRDGETTHIINVGRLRTREGDSLGMIIRELGKLGARIEEFPEHLVVHGQVSLPGGEAQSGNDPRIAMMLAVAATCATGPVGIAGAECVCRLYPDFWDEYARLGGLVRLTA